jgi:hypothetical protein
MYLEDWRYSRVEGSCLNQQHLQLGLGWASLPVERATVNPGETSESSPRVAFRDLGEGGRAESEIEEGGWLFPFGILS